MFSCRTAPSTETANCTDLDLALFNGESANNGSLMVCVNGLWGKVCFSGSQLDNSPAICQELGFQERGENKYI